MSWNLTARDGWVKRNPESPALETGGLHSLRQILDRMPGVHWYLNTTKPAVTCFQHANFYGYLNPLRPIPIQLVDGVTLEWLYRQGERELQQAPCFDAGTTLATILCDGVNPNPALEEVCRQMDIALLRSTLAPAGVLDFLQANLAKLLSPRCNRHGVFLAVMNTGVIITGKSGIGKSEVALDLVQRGHQLIADDVVEIYRRDGPVLMGECPPSLKGHIEIRGLGIINAEKMFGPAAVMDYYELELIINLSDAKEREIENLDRLKPSLEPVDILGVEIPCLHILVAPGRNLSVLVEAAIRDHLLRKTGANSSLEFVGRHNRRMGIGGEE